MFCTLLLLCSVYISTLNGWGFVGHSLTARIAQSLLTEKAQSFVHDHLPPDAEGQLSTIASWADNILYPDTDPDYLKWQWSKGLHFVNTPEWSCAYDRVRDCDWNGDQYCVDGAIQNYSSRLSNKNLDDTEREQALKFLVHFIGDVHQPLHGGFASDRGGNSIRGTFFGKSTNLHSLWDTGMIQRRMTQDFNNDQTEYYSYLINLMETKYKSDVPQWSKCPSSDEAKYQACSRTWIEEDEDLNCEHVYRDEDDQKIYPTDTFSFSQTYYNTRIVIAEQRLIQAGVRMATVINNIASLEKRKHKKHEDDELCSGTLLLFLLFALQVLLTSMILIFFYVRRKSREPSTTQMEKPANSFVVNWEKV